jgi:predicted porin
MNKTLLATSALVLVAATASAVDVEMYGQVNKGLFGYNDGQDTNVAIVDNAYSSTRMGVKGAQALDNGLTASVLFEGELVDNGSASYTQSAAANTGNAQTVGSNGSAGTFTSRQARVGLSGNFGGVYLGQQSVATDGVLAADLAGAQDVLGQDFAEIGGGLKFRNKTTHAFLAGNTSVNDLTNNNSSYTFGDERANSLRYDSPIYAGFQGRASVQQGGDLDLAAFYDGAVAGFKVAAAAGTQYNNDSTQTASTVAIESITGASVSVAHESGLAATVAYQTESLSNKPSTGDEADSLYGKVGYSWDAFEVAADYGTSENFGTTNASKTDKYRSLDAMGLAAQYNLGSGVSVAGLYRTFSAETGATTKIKSDAIDLYGVNLRVKF